MLHALIVMVLQKVQIGFAADHARMFFKVRIRSPIVLKNIFSAVNSDIFDMPLLVLRVPLVLVNFLAAPAMDLQPIALGFV